MNDDLALASLLGDAPPQPDPGFRFDVFARISARARRRVATARALRLLALTLGLGLIVPLARVLGLSLDELAPVLLVAAVLGLSYLLALFAMGGPAAVLARSRAMLRVRI